MRTQFGCLVGVVTTIGLGALQPASAADMGPGSPIYKAPPVVAFGWTGCYLGANAGWGRSNDDLSTSVPVHSNMIGNARAAIINSGATSIDDNGFTGGGQIGCNWQPAGSVVVGAEGDFNYLHARASRNTGIYVEPASGRTVRSVDTIGMDWFATLRGRVGVAADRVLFYGTGGLAVTKIDASKKFSWDFADTCPIVGGLEECYDGGGSSTRVGWTVGGGVEWAFNGNWSAKAEYLYADFGDFTYRLYNAGAPDVQWSDHTVNATLQIVRVGLNYRFGAVP